MLMSWMPEKKVSMEVKNATVEELFEPDFQPLPAAQKMYLKILHLIQCNNKYVIAGRAACSLRLYTNIFMERFLSKLQP